MVICVNIARQANDGRLAGDWGRSLCMMIDLSNYRRPNRPPAPYPRPYPRDVLAGLIHGAGQGWRHGLRDGTSPRNANGTCPLNHSAQGQK